ncbi:MAG TPA: substrate-binding domain-containing protein, partial [Xanthobacteraceae bacterium]|nr:substrate-binding domain-containing protein [Xanthobacteraceae bacterium]
LWTITFSARRGEGPRQGYEPMREAAINGIKVAGLLPVELQNFVVYGAAIPADNESPDPAAAFVKFAADPSKAAVWRNAGFESTTR